MIKAVLFDLDGTIIDTSELIVQSYKHAYRKHFGQELSRKEIYKYFGEPMINTMKRYDEKNADLLREYYKEFNQKNHGFMTKAFEGARETMSALQKRGIKVGVVTSKRKEMAEKGLVLADIADVLDVFLTPENTNKHKPDPEPILAACAQLGVTPDETLYVGDTTIDMQCSNAAGSRSCLVAYTVQSMDELMQLKPDYIVDRLIDVVKVVEGCSVEVDTESAISNL